MLIHPKVGRGMNAVLLEGFTSHLLADECGSCTPGSAPMSSALHPPMGGSSTPLSEALLCLPKSCSYISNSSSELFSLPLLITVRKGGFPPKFSGGGGS